MRFRIIAAVFALGCTSSQPVVISPADLRFVSERLSGASSHGTRFHVSEIRVRDHEVRLDLTATAEGEGWTLRESASCVRCGDRANWNCSPIASRTFVVLPGGSVADAVGIEGSDAAAAVRFLSELSASSPETLSPADLASTQCLIARDDRHVVVVLGATLHHATTSFGRVVLERSGQAYRLVSQTPPPSWFEGDTSPPGDCFLTPDLAVVSEC